MHLIPPMPPGEPVALSAEYAAAAREAAKRPRPDDPTRHRLKDHGPTAFAGTSAVLRDVGGFYVQQLGTVAVVPLYGIILARPNVLTRYGYATSSDEFARVNELLASDPNVSAIVWDVDSPGGTVAGTPEAFDRLLALRGKVRTVAVANAVMASAAYWLASAAERVVASPSSLVGSVGVAHYHEEYSRAMDKEGVTPTVFRSTPKKQDDHPAEPLGADARASIQARVDSIYSRFAGDVAKARNSTPGKVKAGFGDGGVFTASQAVANGAADKVATLDAALAALKAGRSTDPRMARAEARGRHAEAKSRGL